MKRSLLALSLLLTAPAFALTLKQAQDEVQSAQTALDSENARRDQLSAEVQQHHAATQNGVGQKHASVMEQQQGQFRGKVDEYNQCVTRCQELQDRLHKVVAKVGSEHSVVSDGQKFSVQAAPKGSMEPIVRRSAESAPYSAGRRFTRAS